MSPIIILINQNQKIKNKPGKLGGQEWTQEGRGQRSVREGTHACKAGHLGTKLVIQMASSPMAKRRLLTKVAPAHRTSQVPTPSSIISFDRPPRFPQLFTGLSQTRILPN